MKEAIAPELGGGQYRRLGLGLLVRPVFSLAQQMVVASGWLSDQLLLDLMFFMGWVDRPVSAINAGHGGVNFQPDCSGICAIILRSKHYLY